MNLVSYFVEPAAAKSAEAEAIAAVAAGSGPGIVVYLTVVSVETIGEVKMKVGFTVAVTYETIVVF